ncbi:MAG: hypothetical protein JXB33_04325 [Clostridia bacterium]|nr:hypothetical protein [Clostridia bacterium]
MKNDYYSRILNWVLPIVVVIIILTGDLIEGLFILAAYLVYRFYSERDKFFSYVGKRKFLNGKLQKAVHYYNKACMTKKAEAKVRVSYAYALILSGEFQKAAEALAELQGAPDADTVQMQKAICEAVLIWKVEGNRARASTHLGRIDESLRTSSYYGVMGKMMIESGDIDKARSFNEEAYRYNAKNAGILENLIRIYCNIEDYERAFKVAGLLLNKNPHTPDSFYYCAMANEKCGNHKKAGKLYKKALDYDETILSSVRHEDIRSILESQEEV